MIKLIDLEKLRENPTGDGVEHLATVLGVLLAKMNEVVKVVNDMEAKK